MRATSLILAFVFQSIATASLAQDAKEPASRPIPEEHKDFVAEIESIFGKYPNAATRYRLVDVGHVDFGGKARAECNEDCEWDPAFIGWCLTVCEPREE
jgi:hypothetical protein